MSLYPVRRSRSLYSAAVGRRQAGNRASGAGSVVRVAVGGGVHVVGWSSWPLSCNCRNGLAPVGVCAMGWIEGSSAFREGSELITGLVEGSDVAVEVFEVPLE